MFLNKIKRYASHGILNLNSRNLDYIARHNPRKFYPNADSKIRAKKLALQAGIPVPELYHIVDTYGSLKDIDSIVKDYQDFVVKPEHGAGGDGVLIVNNQNGQYSTSREFEISTKDLQMHIANTLSGLYSLGGQPDNALIEYKIKLHPIFREISYKGIPDIRVVIFLGIPVLAMLRLPTKASRGRANLHQGALGLGINLETGLTTTAYCNGRSIEVHPNTTKAMSGLLIPDWDLILEMASSCYDVFKLGFMGVDIAIDADKGPLLLEANVRPGLAIQLANQKGLKKNLKIIEKDALNLTTITEKIDFARALNSFSQRV